MKKASFYFIIFIILCIIYSFIEPYWIQIKNIDIVSKDIPTSFENTKIVFVTDIHHGPFFSIERLKSLVSKVNNLQPDIILLGGDYVHNDVEDIVPCFNELKNLRANIDKYGVLGNHDNWDNGRITKKGMKDAGIEVLDNQAKWIIKNGQGIKIGGVGDLWFGKQDILPTINDAKVEDFVLLLSHNPEYIEQIKTNKIDLVLSGHTHGGQLTLFGLWSPFTPVVNKLKYRTGFVKTDYNEVFISNGVGAVGYFPMRFFARPQILILNLKTMK